MSLSTASNRVVATGDAVTTIFYFNRLLYDADHLEVYLDDALQSSGYTVSGVPGSSTYVTFSSAPAASVQVLLLRVVPLTQLSVYAVGGAFPAATTEKNFDLAVMALQQFDEINDRSLRLPVEETGTEAKTVLPDVTTRASKYLAWNASGEPIAVDPATASGTSVLATGSTTARLLADRFADWKNVKDFGAIGDGTGNDGPAILAACNAGKNVWFPPGTYRITDTSLAALTQASHDHLQLVGSGVDVTTLNFENGANDCIKVDGTNTGAGQLSGFRISSMTLTSTSKTGGRMLAVSYAYKTILDHLYIECWTGIETYIVNNFDIENVVVIVSGGGTAPSGYYGPAGQAPLNCYGLFWHAPSDGTGRCDGLRTENLIIQGNFSGSDGILMDGLVATWDCITCGVLNSDYGVRVRNTGLNATSNFTNFLECHNLAVEGAKSQALRIEAGVQMRFIGCNFNNMYGAASQGSADTNVVHILADLTYSETRAISFIGCAFHSSKEENVVTAAKSVRFEGCTFADAGRGASNTYSALKIATNSQEVTVVGNNIGMYGANNDYKYGIEVADTTYRVGVIGNNIFGFGTKAISWEGNDAGSMCFGNFGQSGPISQDPVPYGVPKSQTVTGNFTATAAQVLNNILILSGTPGAFDMTMPTAANLVAGVHSPMVNACFPLLLINATNGTCTVKLNTGITLGGNKSGADFTIATGVTRPFTIHLSDVRSASAAVNMYG